MHFPLVPMVFGDERWISNNTIFSGLIVAIAVGVSLIFLIMEINEIEYEQKKNTLEAKIEDHRLSLTLCFLCLGFGILVFIFGTYVVALIILAGVLWLAWKAAQAVFRGFFLLLGFKPKSSIRKWYHRLENHS